MKKKKLMAYLMTAAIIVTVLPANVFAEESQTQEITGESLVDGKKTISVPIEGTINPEFSVKIPSKINISQGENGYGYTGKISVKGAIGLGASVKVKADDSVTLYDVTNRTSQDIPANAEDQDYTHNTEKTAPVTQEKSVWEQTELDPNTYTDSGISFAVGNLQIGTWKGKIDFSVEYVAPVDPGLYAENGTYTSWQQLVDHGLISVTDAGAVVSGYDNTRLMTDANYNKNTSADALTGDLVIPSTTKLANGSTVTVTSIGDYGLKKCVNLTSVTLPDTITSIGIEGFYNCTSLNNINIPDGVTTIKTGAFGYCPITEITLPSGLTAISQETFRACKQLKSIAIPEGVTQIGKNAFAFCEKMKSADIPSTIMKIDEAAFSSAGLEQITIPNNPSQNISIGKKAFSQCTNMTSMYLSSKVISIGQEMLYNTPKLTNLTFTGTIQQWNSITKGADWHNASGITEIVCSDGNVSL